MSHTRTKRNRRVRPPKPKHPTRPAKQRYAIAADGRIGRPDIFEYETVIDGLRYPVQPRDGRAYVVIVHDRAAYERLIQTGWLNGPQHSGPRSPIVDARRTW